MESMVAVVTVVEAKNLAPSSSGSGDCYANLRIVGYSSIQKQRTRVIFNSLNPWWGESFQFSILPSRDVLSVKVWDRDISGNQSLGHLTFSFANTPGESRNPDPAASSHSSRTKVEKWFPLLDGRGAELYMIVRLFNPKDPELAQLLAIQRGERAESNKGLDATGTGTGGGPGMGSSSIGYWMRDSESKKCLVCGVSFTLLNRRHHCRICGRLVCNDCSPKSEIRPYEWPTRVCKPCLHNIRNNLTTGRPVNPNNNSSPNSNSSGNPTTSSQSTNRNQDQNNNNNNRPAPKKQSRENEDDSDDSDDLDE